MWIYRHFQHNLFFYYIINLANIRKVNVHLIYQEVGMGIASPACGDISLKTPFFQKLAD